MNNIVIGPCGCGGYGQVFDESAQKETMKCHEDLDDLYCWKNEHRRQFMHNNGVGYLFGFHEEDVDTLIQKIRALRATKAEGAE